MLNSRQIKQIIQDNSLYINKRFGQNFLINEKISDKLIASCDIREDDVILEIGPGLGALTEAILPLCKRVIAIDKDRGLSGILTKTFSSCNNLEVINKDILKVDIPSICHSESQQWRSDRGRNVRGSAEPTGFGQSQQECRKNKLKIIGNLPYYITSPIIFHLLEHKRYIDSIYITIQKEVAKRIVAQPGCKDYGVLTCGVGYHCKPEILMNIPKSSFYPQPKVDSSFLKLDILKEPSVNVEDEELLFKIIRSAFNQRRKTLFNALLNSAYLQISKETLTQAFSKTGLDPKIRGETLSLQDFAKFSSAIS
ncbi:ribosomal RNA small subunit methyltransferase A [Candidatus Omnitrophota bacterium]